MAIEHTDNVISLHTAHSTYQMMVDETGRLLHLYYGRRSAGVMDYLIPYNDRGFCGNPYDAGNNRTYSLACLPQEYPTFGTGDFRSPALEVVTEDGKSGCDLRVTGVLVENGKYALEGLPAVHADSSEAQTLVVTLEDKNVPIKVELLYGVLPEGDIITRAAKITNTGDTRFYITRAMAVNLDFLTGPWDLLSLYGYQGMERQMQRTPVTFAEQRITSRRGTSSHQANPFAILAAPETNENSGSCYAVEMVYSGGCEILAGRDPYRATRLQAGLSEHLLRYPVDPGKTFVVPEAILSFSATGFSDLSIRLADCIRDHLMRGPYKHKATPILLNSWEGCYFTFDGNKLLALAKEAKEMDLDLLVVDDGWFGKRDDDTSGLGDWVVNEKKLGMPLTSLIDQVHDLGLSFGIWVEPEMVSEDSDLYRAHPDWALVTPGRYPVRGRYQLVLDFSRPEVVDHVYQQLVDVLDQRPVEYLKWDCNRSIADVWSNGTSDQGRVLYDYVLGLYDLLERLGKRYPKMLIETCSGGGGRFDAGMLCYSRQIWCSDNTDAIDRLKIQYGTSFGYPTDAMGAHVSKVPNEQCGRITPIETRAAVAMAGTFGYELDPAKMSEDDRNKVREQAAFRRANEDLIFFGDYVRLSDPYTSSFTAWSNVAKDRSAFLLTAVETGIQFADEPVRYVKLSHLNADALYRCSFDGKVYPGAALMETGIPLPQAKGEYHAFQWRFETVR